MTEDDTFDKLKKDTYNELKSKLWRYWSLNKHFFDDMSVEEVNKEYEQISKNCGWSYDDWCIESRKHQ